MRISRNCEISQSESLSAYVDGMVDGQTMRRLAHHVDGCGDCREAVAQLTNTKRRLSQVRNAPPMPSASFWSDAYRTARLSAADPVASPSARSWSWNVKSGWRLGGVAAICATVVLLSFVPTGTMRGIVSQPADAAPTIDVVALVNSHANSTTDEPLADHQRLSMIVSDITAQQADGNAIDDGSDAPDGALDAEPVSN